MRMQHRALGCELIKSGYPYHFFWANQWKADIKIFPWIQCEISNGRLDWHSLVRNNQRMISHSLNRRVSEWYSFVNFFPIKISWNWREFFLVWTVPCRDKRDIVFATGELCRKISFSWWILRKLRFRNIYRPHPKDGDGNVYSLSISWHLGGGRGTYLPGRGVPTFSRWGGRYLPSQVWMGSTHLPRFWMGGGETYLPRSGWGVPTLAEGVPPPMVGTPHQGRYPPPG